MNEQPNNTSNTFDESVWRLRAFKAWAIIGGVLIAAGVVYACSAVHQATTVVVMTAVIVFLFHGLVDSLESKGIPRWGGALVSVLLIAGSIALLGVAVVPSLTDQLVNIAQNSGDYAQKASDAIERVSYALGSLKSVDDAAMQAATTNVIEGLSSALSEASKGMMDGLVAGVAGAGEAMVLLAISLLCSYWVLIDLPTMIREVREVLPTGSRRAVETVFSTMGTVVYGWAKATVVCSILTGVICGVLCAAFGVPYAAMLGVASAVLYMVPYVGVAVAALLAALVGAFASPFAAFAGFLTMVVVHNVVANVVSPKLMGKAVNVHPALVLVAILIGGGVGGAVGMLLAIPVAATIQGLAVSYYERRHDTTITSPDGALFARPEKDGDDEAEDGPDDVVKDDDVRPDGPAPASEGETPA